MRNNRLWLAELATEVVEARGHSSQPWQPFQNGFVPQRLEFFPQCVGDLPKARFQDFQGRSAQSFRPALNPALNPTLNPASSFDAGDVFHTSCLFKLRVFRVCLLYTSDAADDLLCVDLGGR